MAFKSDNICPGNGARVLLKVVSVNGSRAIVQYPDGFKFEVGRRQFEWLGNGNILTLEAGQEITARVLGAGDGLADVCIEGKERASYNGAPDDTPGWTPGIATGDDFNKR